MNLSLPASFKRFSLPSVSFFGLLIVGALAAFEIFNFSTTLFSLTDLLGDLKFLGISWAAILAIAFCGIDFAGIARLFTPEAKAENPQETWYLFGAWMLAASMNAILTWWGVSLALVNHNSLGNDVIQRGTLLSVVPVFVAVLVWLIRVLIIGSFSVSRARLFQVNQPTTRRNTMDTVASRPEINGMNGTIRPITHTQGRVSPSVADHNGSTHRSGQIPPR